MHDLPFLHGQWHLFFSTRTEFNQMRHVTELYIDLGGQWPPTFWNFLLNMTLLAKNFFVGRPKIENQSFKTQKLNGHLRQQAISCIGKINVEMICYALKMLPCSWCLLWMYISILCKPGYELCELTVATLKPIFSDIIEAHHMFDMCCFCWLFLNGQKFWPLLTQISSYISVCVAL